MEEYNLLIVSDLHLCEGLNPKTGKFSRLEDFLFDDAFARFLRYHQAVRTQPRFGDRPWLLIINGDMFDFVQAISLPEDSRVLRIVTGVEQGGKLPITEQGFGLGTTAEESEWKLAQIARGHQGFFAALGWFIAHGNHVAIIKGNHDVELHWIEVRERLVVEIDRAYTRERLMLGHGPVITTDELEARVCFYPWFYYEPGRVYVEHGGQYEPASAFPDFLDPVIPNSPEQIQLPWGSLFVRYLFNKIEDVHPFADNAKPIARYAVWALRKSPIKTLDLLVTRGWVFLRAFWNVAHKTVESALRGPRAGDYHAQPGPALPPDVVERIAATARQRVEVARRDWIGAVIRSLPGLLLILLIALAVLMSLAALWWAAGVCLVLAVGAYFLRRWLSRRFSAAVDDYLLPAARELEKVLKPAHAVRYIVMGHDHKATIERLERAWYVNTGAWVPIYEKEGPIEWRETLTFFRLVWGYEGPPELLCWDDAGGAPTRVVLRPEPGGW
jgi:UDP-2,3-diacylglucosamine pyrophosphatase LpxH